MTSSKSSKVFFTIVFSQFCGTSLWFAGNAALPQLQALYSWHTPALGYLTSAVQLGFIIGTLLFALTGISDRYSPSKIFFFSSLTGALCNVISLFDLSSFPLAMASRFLTGFFLAGIYPVGMKIAADWNEKGLGHWLGVLVGALVLGTAFPHGLKLIPQFVDASSLMITVSFLAFGGGLMILLFVKDGPYRKTSAHFSFAAIRDAFRVPAFRAPAFGYFGHMWEVYAFWAFVPWAIQYYKINHNGFTVQEPLLAFLVIASGTAGCIAGGRLSFHYGSKKIAQIALISSGICCLTSPWIWFLPPEFFLVVLAFWGFMVAADSPQFSALVAVNAPAEIRGSAITVTTCIGFAITIASIQLLAFALTVISPQYILLLLAPGPVIGIVLLNLKR